MDSQQSSGFIGKENNYNDDIYNNISSSNNYIYPQNTPFSFSGYQTICGNVSFNNFSSPSNYSFNSSASPSEDMCNEYMKYINSCYNSANYCNNFYNNSNQLFPSNMSSPQSLDSSSSLSSDNSFDSTVSYQQSNIECTPVKSRKVEIKKHLIKEQINSGVYNKCIKPIPSYYEACQFVIDHIDSEVINFTMRMLMNPENASICHWTKYCWEFVIIDADSFVSAFCHEFDLNRNIITIAHLSKVYRTIGNNNIYGQCIIERVKCRRNAFRLFPKHQSFTYPKLKDFGNNSLATTFFKDEEKKVLIKLRNMQSKVPIFDRKRKGSGQSLSKNVENNGKVPRYEFHPYAGAY